MKTYVLKVTDAQEEVIQALIKALKIDSEIYTEADEDKALFLAMEEGKKYGRLSPEEADKLIQKLGE